MQEKEAQLLLGQPSQATNSPVGRFVPAMRRITQAACDQQWRGLGAVHGAGLYSCLTVQGRAVISTANT